MSRPKRTPEERAEASLKRQEAKASTWPGYDLFDRLYPHPVTKDGNLARLGRILAMSQWESAKPSQKMRVAILFALQKLPGITLDPLNGRQLPAVAWLLKLWPGQSPEELRAMIDDNGAWFDALKAKEALDKAQGIEPGMRELVAMLEVAQVRASRYWPERDDPHVQEWPRPRPCR